MDSNNGQLIIIIWKARGGEEIRKNVIVKDVPATVVWKYNLDTSDFTNNPENKLAVVDGTLSLSLNEHPIFLVTEKPNWLENIWAGIGQSINHAWEGMLASLNSWWEGQQQKLKDWAAQQWESLQRAIQAQVNKWTQQAVKMINQLISQWLRQICGAALLPGGVALVWAGRRRRKG